MWNVCSPSIEIIDNSIVRWWNGPPDFEIWWNIKLVGDKKESWNWTKTWQSFMVFSSVWKKVSSRGNPEKSFSTLNLAKLSLLLAISSGVIDTASFQRKVQRWSEPRFWLQLLSSLETCAPTSVHTRKTWNQESKSYGVLTPTKFRLTPSPEYFGNNTIEQLAKSTALSFHL